MVDNKLIGRKLKYVKLHGTESHIPGIGGLTSTLPPQNKTLDMTMTHELDGLFLAIQYRGELVEATIPWANVQIAVYVPPAEVNKGGTAALEAVAS